MRLKVHIWKNVRRLCTWGIVDPSYQASRKKEKGKHFRGEADHQPKPDLRTGDDLFDMVKNLQVIFRKGPGG
jgi:hypothetical protein